MGVPKFDTPRRAKIRGTVEFFEAHGDLVDKKITKRDIFRYFGVHHATGHSILRGRNPKRRCLGLDSESNETLWGCSDPDARTIENDPRYDKERLKTQYWHTLAAPEYDTSETRDVEIFGTRFWREELWGNAQRRFAWLDLAIPAELNMHFSPKNQSENLQSRVPPEKPHPSPRIRSSTQSLSERNVHQSANRAHLLAI